MRFRWRQQQRVLGTSDAAERPEEAFAELLLDECREELARADGKASILFSASGIVVGALLATLLAGRWTPAKLHHHPATEVLFWSGAGFMAAGLTLLAWAVLPSIRHTGKREALAYFGDVVRYQQGGFAVRKSTQRDRDQQGKAALGADIHTASAARFDRTVDQLWTVSLIVNRKYRRIRWALLLFALATAQCVGAVVIDANI